MENFKEVLLEFMKILNECLEEQRRLDQEHYKNKTNHRKKPLNY